MEITKIFVQEIIKRPLNQYDELDIENWLEVYDKQSLKESLIDLVVQVGNGKLNVYSTNYIKSHLNRCCLRA